MDTASGGRMAVIARYFPKLSETFIAQEIALLEDRGLDLAIFAMPRTSEEPVQPVARAIRAPIHHFPPYRRERARIVGGNLRAFAMRPLRYLRALGQARRDAQRWPGRRRMRRFFEAGWLVGRMGTRGPGRLAHVHSHFLYETSEIGRYAAAIAGVPHTIEAHAKDIYLADPELVAELVTGSDGLLTCTGFGAAAIRELPGVEARKVHTVYHGVDTDRFRPAETERAPGPARLVSVGRLVAKKGYDDILEALSVLRDAGVDWRYDVYGDGRLRSELEEIIDRLGLGERVRLHGSVTTDVVGEALAAADAFVCGSRPTEDGDRDGIPNSLAEAMACGVPVVATDVSGIPELLESGRSGVIVPPGDPKALAAGLQEILGDGESRRRLGAGARERVCAVFDSRRCIDDCVAVLGGVSPGLVPSAGGGGAGAPEA